MYGKLDTWKRGLIVLVCLAFVSGLGHPAAGEGKTINFTILHTNDEHSALIPHYPALDHKAARSTGWEDPTSGGLGRLASAVEEVREERERAGEPVFLFNAGDFLGGAIFGWLALQEEAPELTLLQEIGYDAVALGNHEFDYGPEVLSNYLQAAGYPQAHEQTAVLGTNIGAPSGHPLVEQNLYLDTKIFEKKGLTVGTFSLMGEDAASVIAEPGQVEFLDPHQHARRAVDQLRKQGADVVVAITHSGVEEDRELAKEVEGIDVIVGGHSHTALREPIVSNETIIVQAYYNVNYLGNLKLVYDEKSGQVDLRDREQDDPYLIPIDARFEPDPEISRLLGTYIDKLDNLVDEISDYESIFDPVAFSEFEISNRPPLEESPAGNFITDAMRLATEEILEKEVDVALQANGSIRRGFHPATLGDHEGELSFYNLAGAVGLGSGQDGYPGYSIVSVYLTGEELKSLLEVAVLLKEQLGDTYFLQFSGLSYDYNPEDAILFTVPFLDLPIPTTRAVKEARLFTGDGLQPGGANERDFVGLRDQKLYHLVTDTYVLSFLPLVGEVIPRLKLNPKGPQGKPVEPDETGNLTVDYRGRELKVWDTVIKHAGSGAGPGNLPWIPNYYRETSNRINAVWTFPLLNWIALCAALVVLTLALLFRVKRKLTH